MTIVNRNLNKFQIPNYLYYIYLTVFFAIFLFRDLLEFNIPLLALLIYISIGYLIFNYDQSLAISLIMPLFTHGFQTNYAIMIACFFYLMKFSRGMRINIIHISMALLLIFEFCHAVIEPFSIAEYFRYFVQYLYLALILGESRIKKLLKDSSLILKTFILADAFFMLDVFLVTLKYIDVSEILYSGFRFGTLDEFLIGKPTLYDNENMVALFALIGINLIACLLKRSRNCSLLKICGIIYFMIFGLLTSSKTFIICLSINILLYLIFYLKKHFLKTLVISFVIFSISTIVFNTQLSILFERTVDRFINTEFSSGRFALIKEFNDFIFTDIRNILFGIGLQSIVDKTGANNTTHNAIQEIFLCWGIIGFVIISVVFFAMMKNVKRHGKRIDIFNFVPFFIYFLFIQTIQFVRLSSIFGLIPLLYVAMLMGGYDDKKAFSHNSRHRRR